MNTIMAKKEFLVMIYKKHKQKMYSVAYNILKDKQKSEDIVQDCIIAFDKVYESIKDLEEKNLFYYVIRTVKNKALNNLKRLSKVIPVDFQENESLLGVVDYDISLNLMEEELIEYIKEHLSKISKTQADVFMYKYHYDYSNEQIAKILFLSDNNVRVLVYRAKKNIKDVIQKWGIYEQKNIR